MKTAFNPYRRITPQAKIIGAAERIGNGAIAQNQGTTYELYDYVKLNTSATDQTITFFNALNTKAFPFTNISQNQLQAGEAIAVEYIFFSLIYVTKGSTEVVKMSAAQLDIPGVNLGNFSLNLDNNRVIKPISLMRANSLFNVHGKTAANYVFYPDTDLTIQSQLQFTAQLQLPPVTSPAPDTQDIYIGCHLTGTAAILNVKTSV